MAVAHALPTATADGAANTPSRADTDLSAFVRGLGADQHALAGEGAYYLVNTTTPGTGVAGHAAPVAADLSTKPLILLYNGGLKTIYPDFIKVRMTAIGAGATTTDFDSWYDQSNATRYSSGAIAVTPVNCLSASYGSAGGATVYFGAAVTVAAVQAKRVGHSRVRSVVPVVEDQYIFTFGQSNQSMASALASSGTAIVQTVVPMAPVAIAPGGNFLFVEWGVSQSGAHSFDMEFAYYER